MTLYPSPSVPLIPLTGPDIENDVGCDREVATFNEVEEQEHVRPQGKVLIPLRLDHDLEERSSHVFS